LQTETRAKRTHCGALTIKGRFDAMLQGIAIAPAVTEFADR